MTAQRDAHDTDRAWRDPAREGGGDGDGGLSAGTGGDGGLAAGECGGAGVLERWAAGGECGDAGDLAWPVPDGEGGDPGLVRVRDGDGRVRGTGFVADRRGTVVTSHEAVDGADRLIVTTAGGRRCAVTAREVTPLPGLGLALVRTEGLGVAPLPVTVRERVEPGTYVWFAAGGSRWEARVLGTAPALYAARDRRHLLDAALELAPGTAGCEALRAGVAATGGPVRDAATGAVLGVLGTGLSSAHRDADFAVPLRVGESGSVEENGPVGEGTRVVAGGPAGGGGVVGGGAGETAAVGRPGRGDRAGGGDGTEGWAAPAGGEAVDGGRAAGGVVAGPLGALLAENAATVPAYGADLNLAGVLELTAAGGVGPAGERSVLAVEVGDVPADVRDAPVGECVIRVGERCGPAVPPEVEPVERAAVVAEFAAFGAGDAVVLALVGAPGSGRSTELAALAARRRPEGAPTIRLRGADLHADDTCVADAARRALDRAARAVATAPAAPPGGPGGIGPGDTDPGRVARLARAAGRPLLVLLDGPEEMPPELYRRLADWTARTADWLRCHGARLVLACGAEYWETAGAAPAAGDVHTPVTGGAAPHRLPARVPLGDLGADEARRARSRHGIPEGVLHARDARHPLTLRLLSEVRAALPDGADRDVCLDRYDVFAAHLDLMCLRVAHRIAAAHGVRGTAVRRLAARVAGQVHEAARRTLGTGQSELDRTAFQDVFPEALQVSGVPRDATVSRDAAVAGEVGAFGPPRESGESGASGVTSPDGPGGGAGPASAVLAEGLLVRAGGGYRFPHEEFADWLQGTHLDLDEALAALVHRRPGPDTARPVPRHRIGPVVQALLLLARQDGSPPLAARLEDLVRALDTDPGNWWAVRLLAATLPRLPDATPYERPLRLLAERLAARREPFRDAEFGPAFWDALALPDGPRCALLRELVRADGPRGGSGGGSRGGPAAQPRDGYGGGSPGGLAHGPRGGLGTGPADGPGGSPGSPGGAPHGGPAGGSPGRYVDSLPGSPGVPGLPGDALPGGPADSPPGQAAYRSHGRHRDNSRSRSAATPSGRPTPAPRFLDAVARLLADRPVAVVPRLVDWFDDERPLPATPHATVGAAAQALLHTHRHHAPDTLTEALADSGHPRAAELLDALAQDDPSALCRAVDRWAHDDRPRRRAAALTHALRTAPHARTEPDRILLRYAALALLARPADRALHGGALALLVRDQHTRAQHLTEALRHFASGDPLFPPGALAGALVTHPGPVLDAFRRRLRLPGAGPALRVLADVTTPGLALRVAALLRETAERHPHTAGDIAAYAARSLDRGPAARPVLLPLLGTLLADGPEPLRAALATVLGAPGTPASRPVRRELREALLAREDAPAVLDALLRAAAPSDDGDARDLVHRAGLRLVGTPEGAARFGRALADLSGEVPGFAARLAAWLADAPEHWAPLVGPGARPALDGPGPARVPAQTGPAQ